MIDVYNTENLDSTSHVYKTSWLTDVMSAIRVCGMVKPLEGS